MTRIFIIAVEIEAMIRTRTIHQTIYVHKNIMQEAVLLTALLIRMVHVNLE